MSGYLCVSGEAERTEIIEKSRFVCYLKGIENEEEAKAFVAAIKKKNSLATHNCYAYIADEKGLVQKFSDDGEPQGTAGLPMLGALKSRGIYKTVAVVTRYFGGIKLGTGGLARAYGGAVAGALQSAKILDMQSADVYELTLDYDGYVKIAGGLKEPFIKVISTDFSENVCIRFAVKNDEPRFYKQFSDLALKILKGRVDITKTSSSFYCF